MATLTWRNVDAPDFRGSLDGFRTAADLLQNAATGWNKNLAAMDAREAAAQQLEVNRVDMDQATQKMRQVEQGIAQTAYENGRTRTENEELDANAGNVSALLASARGGDTTATTQLLSNLRTSPALTQKLYKVASGVEGDAATALALKLKRDLDEQTRKETATVLEFGNNLQGKAPDAATAYKLLNEGIKGQSPAVVSGMRKAATSLFPDMLKLGGVNDTPLDPNAPASVDSVTGSGTGYNMKAYNTPVGNGKFGTPPKDITASSIKEVMDFGNNVLIPATRGNASLGLSKNQGTSAQGAYQFTAGTLKDIAPRVFGDKWEQTKMSPENQDKLAEALFNERKHLNLQKTWQGLPDTAVGAYKDVPWSKMKDIIAKHEVGQSLGGEGTAPGKVTAASGDQRTAAASVLQNVVNESETSYLKGMRTARTDNTNLQGVITAATGKGGVFSGVDEKQYSNVLSRIMEKNPGMKPTEAAVIAAEGWKPNSGRSFLFGTTDAFDMKKIEAMASDYGNVLAREFVRGKAGDNLAAVTKAAVSTKEAVAAVKDLESRIAGGATGLSGELARYKETARAAIEKENRLLAEQRSDTMQNSQKDNAVALEAAKLRAAAEQAKNKAPREVRVDLKDLEMQEAGILPNF